MPITDPARLVHRVVVDPIWVQDAAVSPQAFMPRPQDHGSLPASAQGCSAAEAHAAWLQRFPRSRANRCLTVTVADLHAAGLTVLDDSAEGDLHVGVEANPGVHWPLAAEHLARVCQIWAPQPNR